MIFAHFILSCHNYHYVFLTSIKFKIKVHKSFDFRAIREHKMDQGMIFCRTKLDCDNMEQYFKNLGYGSDFATCLHGDRKPAERKANLERFKSGKIKVMMVVELNSKPGI